MVNFPRGPPHSAAETPPLTAEMAEIFEVDRKLWSPLVVTYEVIKWGRSIRAERGMGPTGIWKSGVDRTSRRRARPDRSFAGFP